MTDLLIVESPAKAKKIASFLDGFEVVATVGHFRELPPDEMGVEPPEFRPAYVTAKGKEKVVSRIRGAANRANQIFIGTDLDREGESIAWHVSFILGKKHQSKIKRVRYSEISKAAISKAIRQAGDIDFRTVRAQEGRRVLDRLVGYMVSPALGNALNCWGLSAGRVQSVALKLLVERKQAREQFVPIDHYGLRACFETSGIAWTADWDFSRHLKASESENETGGRSLWTDRQKIQSVHDAASELAIANVECGERTTKPPKPLVTSEMLKVGSKAMDITVKQVMAAAQALFEAGLITYHRTDSPTIDADYVPVIRQYASARGLPLPESAPNYKARAGAQEAHEGIRVTDIHRESVDDQTQELNARKLYRLIHYYTLVSQLMPGVDDVTRVTLVNEADGELFVAKGRRCKSKGWRGIPNPAGNKYADAITADKKDQSLPRLTVGEHHPVLNKDILSRKTKPPALYTESSLVDEMEKKGVGRPSTYAAIIETLLARRYAVIEKGRRKSLAPTGLGEVVVASLNNSFSFMDVAYTSSVESLLDDIASGQARYIDMVTEAHKALTEEIAAFSDLDVKQRVAETVPGSDQVLEEKRKSKSKNSKNSKNGKKGGKSSSSKVGKGGAGGSAAASAASKASAKVGGKCPDCKEGTLVVRSIKTGKNAGKEFKGCTGYPKCSFFQWHS